MPLEFALRSKPSARRAGSGLGILGVAAAWCLLACTSPKGVTIAEFPSDAGPDSGVSAAGAGGEPIVVAPTRGRVKVARGQLVSDVNTPLRGLLLPVDTSWALGDYDLEVITSYAQNMGLNTLHVYLEDDGQVTGSLETEADALVAQAGRVGMYVIIGVGTGMNVGAFNPTKLNDFWSRYAPRYANQPHVLYEIQNNPEITACGSLIAAQTLDMERSIYQLIRAAAPDTHVLLLSTTSLLEPNTLEDAITSLGPDVDWANASIDMDVTNLQAPCQPLAGLSELTAVAQKYSAPLLVGQLPPTGWGPYLSAFEQAGLGWMQYTFFADKTMRTLSGYVSAVKAANVSWCPDQGTFPQDSRRCH